MMGAGAPGAARTAKVQRRTAETRVVLELDLDGTGVTEISTGIGFFDHLLGSLAKHGYLDLGLKAEGDLGVDAHHLVEDVGLCLGDAFSEALGSRERINRFGHALVPMDETLASVVVDISGRPYLCLWGEVPPGRMGMFDMNLVEDFLRAFSTRGGMTLHVHLQGGRSPHHAAEAMFKALGRALEEASRLHPRERGIPSTKGVLS